MMKPLLTGYSIASIPATKASGTVHSLLGSCRPRLRPDVRSMSTPSSTCKC